MQIRERAQTKLSEVEQKITSLQVIQHAIKALIAACDGNMPIQQCPIIEKLQQSDFCIKSTNKE